MITKDQSYHKTAGPIHLLLPSYIPNKIQAEPKGQCVFRSSRSRPDGPDVTPLFTPGLSCGRERDQRSGAWTRPNKLGPRPRRAQHPGCRVYYQLVLSRRQQQRQQHQQQLLLRSRYDSFYLLGKYSGRLSIDCAAWTGNCPRSQHHSGNWARRAWNATLLSRLGGISW